MLKKQALLLFARLAALFLLLPNFAFAAIMPNDPYAQQNAWWWDSIRAPEAWEKNKGSKDVIVAVIDGGVDINHPDLKDNIWTNPKESLNNIDDDFNGYIDDVNGWDFLEDDPVVTPIKNKSVAVSKQYHHGTLVAGIIGAVGNNGIGAAGVNWNVKIMPLRALDDAGNGHIESVNKAIYYAIQHGASVINLSLVTETFDKSFQKAISDAYRAGVIVVTAIGNAGNKQQLVQNGGIAIGENLSFPVCFDAESTFQFIIGVGSIDQFDKISSFSNYGKCLDILAPGSKVASTAVYAPLSELADIVLSNLSGTSLAAPFVSGAAALLKSAFPAMTHDAIITAILDGARNIDALNPSVAGLIGRGALDIYGAFKKADQFIPKNLIYTLHEEDKKVVWQSFDTSFIKKWKWVFDVPYAGIVSWEVFDYDFDGEDELILLVGREKSTEVQIYNVGGVRERVFKVANSRMLGARIFSPDLPARLPGGIGIGWSKSGRANITLWRSDGRPYFEFDTGINAASSMNNVDVFWDKDTERIVVANLENTSVKLTKFDVIGVPFETKTTMLVRPLVQKELSTSKFIYKHATGNGARDAVRHSLKGYGAIVRIDELDGEKRRTEFNPFSADFKGGVDLDISDWDHDGKFDIVVAAGPGASPFVRIYTGEGKLKKSFRPAKIDYKGGVQVRSAD